MDEVTYEDLILVQELEANPDKFYGLDEEEQSIYADSFQKVLNAGGVPKVEEMFAGQGIPNTTVSDKEADVPVVERLKYNLFGNSASDMAAYLRDKYPGRDFVAQDNNVFELDRSTSTLHPLDSESIGLLDIAEEVPGLARSAVTGTLAGAAGLGTLGLTKSPKAAGAAAAAVGGGAEYLAEALRQKIGEGIGINKGQGSANIFGYNVPDPVITGLIGALPLNTTPTKKAVELVTKSPMVKEGLMQVGAQELAARGKRDFAKYAPESEVIGEAALKLRGLTDRAGDFLGEQIRKLQSSFSGVEPSDIKLGQMRTLPFNANEPADKIAAYEKYGAKIMELANKLSQQAIKQTQDTENKAIAKGFKVPTRKMVKMLDEQIARLEAAMATDKNPMHNIAAYRDFIDLRDRLTLKASAKELAKPIFPPKWMEAFPDIAALWQKKQMQGKGTSVPFFMVRTARSGLKEFDPTTLEVALGPDFKKGTFGYNISAYKEILPELTKGVQKAPGKALADKEQAIANSLNQQARAMLTKEGLIDPEKIAGVKAGSFSEDRLQALLYKTLASLKTKKGKVGEAEKRAMFAPIEEARRDVLLASAMNKARTGATHTGATSALANIWNQGGSFNRSVAVNKGVQKLINGNSFLGLNPRNLIPTVAKGMATSPDIGTKDQELIGSWLKMIEEQNKMQSGGGQ